MLSSKPFTEGLLSPFSASPFRPVVLLSCIFSTATTVPSISSIVRQFNEGGEERRAHVSTFKMAPYRSRIPFRLGREPRGSSPRSRRALPRLRSSRALPRPPIKRLSTAAPPREETVRAFIPMPCASPRAFLHALHDETREP